MTQGDRTKGLLATFEKNVVECGDSVAIAAADGELGFKELLECANRLAGELAAAGIKPGALVILSLPNGVSFVPTLLALWKRGCVVALASPKYHSAEIAAIVGRLRPQAMVTTSQPWPAALGNVISAQLSVGSATIAAHAFADHREVDPNVNDLALIKLTSGSTGEPKGIALTPGNLAAEAKNICNTLSVSAADRIIAPVPLCHSYGFDLGVLPLLVRGASLVVRESFVPRALLKDIGDPQASIVLGLPSMYRFLLEIETPNAPALGHLRYLLSCTSPLNPRVISEFYERFGVAICQHYGASESGAISNHLPAEVMRKPQAVGKAVAGVEIGFCDASGRDLPAGQEGEIVVRSAAVASRYVMGAPSDRTPLKDGSFRTGDSGYIDGEGYLHVSGRIDSVINVGGLKVYPLEVVHVLEGLPQIKEAVVQGVKDGLGEEVPCAIVTLKAPLSEGEILKHCHQRLAEYKVPRRIKIIDKIPTGPTGKPLFPVEVFGS